MCSGVSKARRRAPLIPPLFPAPPAPFHQFKPAPGPLMAPTRKNMLAPLPSSKITKAEERAEGQVARRVYSTYFRCERHF